MEVCIGSGWMSHITSSFPYQTSDNLFLTAYSSPFSKWPQTGGIKQEMFWTWKHWDVVLRTERHIIPYYLSRKLRKEANSLSQNFRVKPICWLTPLTHVALPISLLVFHFLIWMNKPFQDMVLSWLDIHMWKMKLYCFFIPKKKKKTH